MFESLITAYVRVVSNGGNAEHASKDAVNDCLAVRSSRQMNGGGQCVRDSTIPSGKHEAVGKLLL